MARSARASLRAWLLALLGVSTLVVAAIVVLTLERRPPPGTGIPLDPTPPVFTAPAAPGDG